MEERIISCPKCKHHISVRAFPGEKKLIICPECSTKGTFTFPSDSYKKTISNDYAIQVENLTKKFNNFTAVNQISFHVKKGEIFGFLGPNGAGKTTTIKMLTTILKPNQGNIKISSYEIGNYPLQVKQRIGFMPDVPGFYSEMRAEDILHFYAEFYKIPKAQRQQKITELFEMMNLDHKQFCCLF